MQISWFHIRHYISEIKQFETVFLVLPTWLLWIPNTLLELTGLQVTSPNVMYYLETLLFDDEDDCEGEI